MSGEPFLRIPDLARIWTEEARKAHPHAEPPRTVTYETAASFHNKSRLRGLSVEEAKARGAKYVDNPVPEPAGWIGRIPYWLPSQEPELRAWYHSRKGAGFRSDLIPKQ